MKSGLGDRNNEQLRSKLKEATQKAVSMKSGLGDRNNMCETRKLKKDMSVSMKSGLGDRNNRPPRNWRPPILGGLNEVRSWRPEQCR